MMVLSRHPSLDILVKVAGVFDAKSSHFGLPN
jgi:hypothetical protein